MGISAAINSSDFGVCNELAGGFLKSGVIFCRPGGGGGGDRFSAAAGGNDYIGRDGGVCT